MAVLPDTRSDQKVLLGHITGVYGLKGWVKVHSDTNPRQNIVTFPRWWVEKSGKGEWVEVLDGRPQGKTIIARLKGVDSPESASVLIGGSIAIERSAMPALDEGEHYWSDLIGMHVRTVDGVDVGPAVRLFETGANDVMVVEDRREADSGSGSSNGTDEGADGSESNNPNRSSRGSAKVKEVLVPWLVPDVIKEVDQTNNVITIDWDPDF